MVYWRPSVDIPAFNLRLAFLWLPGIGCGSQNRDRLSTSSSHLQSQTRTWTSTCLTVIIRSRAFLVTCFLGTFKLVIWLSHYRLDIIVTAFCRSYRYLSRNLAGMGCTWVCIARPRISGGSSNPATDLGGTLAVHWSLSAVTCVT